MCGLLSQDQCSKIYMTLLIVSQKHNLGSQIMDNRLSNQSIEIINTFTNFTCLKSAGKGDSYLNSSDSSIFTLPSQDLKLKKQEKTDTDS